MDPTPHPDSLAGKKVLLMGLGAFGGGAGCARALAKRGALITVTDLRSEEQLRASLDSLEGVSFDSVLGEHRRESFEWADWVVVNPAVPQEASWLQVARELGCKITTEVNLALCLAKDVPAIAITGTHGKSTTAAMVHQLLQGLPGRTVLGGNLGGSLLEQVEGLTSADRLVVELSSFQLERLVAPAGWPEVAIFTCLRPDHLDRHGTFEAYAEAKFRLLDFQSESCLTLIPQDEASLDSIPNRSRGEVRTLHHADLQPPDWGFGEEALPFEAGYQLSSFQLAAEAAIRLGLPELDVANAFVGFEGLPHRMQELASPDRRRFVDNGVATHPEATVAALSHFKGALQVVIGGYDKGLPLGTLPAQLASCEQVHLFGAGGMRVQEALSDNFPGRVSFHASCAIAIQSALAESRSSVADVLFSPSFASFDEFANFRERALLFQNFCQEEGRQVKNTPGDAEAATY